MNTFALPRTLIIFAVVIPVALVLGYVLASPEELTSIAVVGLVLLVLCIPLLLKWHYPILLFSWNAGLIIFLLPGQPGLWMLMAGVSLGLTILAYLLNKQSGFQILPSITFPLMFLVLVVLVTGKLTGGIGLRSLGGESFGGKKLVFIFAAIVGYFAISGRRIFPHNIGRYTGLYFLSALTTALPNLIYMAGPGLWWLFMFFPSDMAMSQAMDDFASVAGSVTFSRLSGLAFAGFGVYSFMLMRYGISGILQLNRWWRPLLFLVVVSLSTLGGFRSVLVMFALTFMVQFYFEGLFRTRFLLVLILGVVLGGSFLVMFAERLPLSVQRSLSILPIKIDPVARYNAEASVEWRVEMWKVLLPQVPQYLILGKGYAIDPTDMYLVGESVRRGLAKDYEVSLLAGDYHNGPLSVIIPFGIFGMAAFIWLLAAGVRVLYRNYRFSDPALQKVNTFLLSYFVGRSVFFFVGFGSLHSDLSLFLGTLGLSVALNGVRNERSAPVAVPAQAEMLPAPVPS